MYPLIGQPLYPGLWSGCIGAWSPGLGPTGLTLRDWSGFGNHGTLTNMDPGTDWVSDAGRYALDFDGSNDTVTLPASYGEGTTTGSFSVTAWAKLRAQSAGVVFGRFANSKLLQLHYETFSSYGWRVAYGVSPFDDIRVGSLAVLNRWYALAFTFAAGTGSLYVDGIAIGADAALTGAFNDTTPNNIGRRAGDNLVLFNGQIDDVRLYNRAISAAEVRLLASRRGIAYEMATRRRSSSAVQFNRRRRLLVGAGS